jgi:phospholipid/cholesterol/gamma-HCH transport system substrate-binding protein
MPRTRSLAWSELKVGILAITAVVIAAVLIFMLGGESGFFWERYHLKTRFSNIATLKPGSPVRVAGIEVGSIAEVTFAGAEVEILMEVSEDVQDRVRTTSVASIGSVSLLGEGAIDITASLQGTPIPDWGYVRASGSQGTFGEALEQGSVALQQATLLIEDVRAGKGTIGKLVTDEAVYRELQQFIATAQEVTAQINRGGGTLGRLVRDPTAARSLERSLDNLNTITTRISAGEGTLGQLVSDDSLAQSLKTTTASLDALAAKLNRGDGTAGRLVNDATLYNRLDSITARLDRLVEQLNAGEGTAGQLFRDKQLYDNANAAASELRGLVSDIRKDPRKYLNVKVSVF